MNWEAVTAGTAVVCSLAALVSAWQSLSMRSVIADLRTETANLRTEIANGRAKDREEMRAWINGSFMRAAVVQADLKVLEARIEHVEDKTMK